MVGVILKWDVAGEPEVVPYQPLAAPNGSIRDKPEPAKRRSGLFL